MNRLFAVVTCSCVFLSAGCAKPSASVPPPQASTAHLPDSPSADTSDAERYDATAVTLATLKAVQTELELDRDGKKAQYYEVKDLQPEQVPVSDEILYKLSRDSSLLVLGGKWHQANEYLSDLKTRYGNDHPSLARAANEVSRLESEYRAEKSRQTLKLQSECIESRKNAYLEAEELLRRVSDRVQLANKEQRELDRERYLQERKKQSGG